MIHFFFSLIFSIFFLISGCAFKEKGLIAVEEIQKDVYVATDLKYHNSRVLIVKGKEGSVVIVSSPFEDNGSRKLMEWVNKNLSPKRMIAINTHYHLDGTGGNPIYHKHNIETWASSHTNKLSKKHGPAMMKDRSVEIAKNEFDEKDGKTISFDGETIEVIYPGRSHSEDHVAVFFKDRKVLFGGCMIKPGKTLGYMGNADIKSWKKAMLKLSKLDFDILVAGHARWGGRELLDKTINNLTKASKEDK